MGVSVHHFSLHLTLSCSSKSPHPLLWTNSFILYTVTSPITKSLPLFQKSSNDLCSVSNELRSAQWTMFTSHKDISCSVSSEGRLVPELCPVEKRAGASLRCWMGQGHFLKSIRPSILSHSVVDTFSFHIIPVGAVHDNAVSAVPTHSYIARQSDRPYIWNTITDNFNVSI